MFNYGSSKPKKKSRKKTTTKNQNFKWYTVGRSKNLNKAKMIKKSYTKTALEI